MVEVSIDLVERAPLQTGERDVDLPTTYQHLSSSRIDPVTETEDEETHNTYIA